MGTRVFLAVKLKMAALLQLFSRKRRAEEEFLSLQYKINEEVARKRFVRETDFEIEASEPAVMSAIVITKSNRNERGLDELRNGDWWTNGYQNWDEASFKKRLRVSRDTFEFILGETKDLIKKEPTRMKPHPTPPATQLALCLYRLAHGHGCTFLTVGDLFGVAESTAHIIFQGVCKAIAGCLYDRLVYPPRNLQEWSQELENFLANWEFPCVGAWDGFMFTSALNLRTFIVTRKDIL